MLKLGNIFKFIQKFRFVGIQIGKPRNVESCEIGKEIFELNYEGKI